MWWDTPFKVLYSCAAFSGMLMYGSYYFVQLRGACGATSLPECISNGAATPTKPTIILPSFKPAPQAKTPTTPDRPQPPAGQGAKWPQTTASEELLIWSGHLDGEIGRVALSDFNKAVRDFQATLVPGIASEERQIAVLQKRVSGIRSAWRFDRVSDADAAELSLPHKLLPSMQELSHGRRYQSSTGDFVVDVAQWNTDETTVEKARQFHCCRISQARRIEGAIVDTSDAGGPGFLLSARDGQRRVSVRAQQKDGTIRILAIDYDVAKDKDYRILRNAIASSYVAFGPVRKREERVFSACQRNDGERCADKPPAEPAPWNNRQGPL